MKWITNLFSGSIGKITDGIFNAIEERNFSEEEKAQIKIELKKIAQSEMLTLEETLRSEISAKERIIVAELNQSDTFTKRTRPTVVYSGLAFIFLNYCIFPLVGIFAGKQISLELPVEFWVAWGSIYSIYSVGRSAEKLGVKSSIAKAITGSTKLYE